ncbi:MAG TPA: pitrilysin family protein [Gemmatimonadaceae bacterium]
MHRTSARHPDHARALTSLSGVERRTLRNGLRVLVRRDSSAPVAAIVTYVNAGYFDETDDVVGIAHVLEHMYFKGTPTRGVGEIARQTKAVGGYLNAATIYDHTLYYAVVPSSGLDAALEIQSDAYHNSLIDRHELANELEVIIQEAKRKADNPAAIANETLHELMHDRHRIRRWRIGREEGLRQLTSDAVRGFYRNFYRPATTTLVVVGDVDVERAFAAVERLYGDMPAGEPSRTPGPSEASGAEFRYRELSGDIAQTQFALGWRTMPLEHPDTPALEMLSSVLSAGRASRLYRATRERKLVSSISAYNYTPRDLGLFVVQGESPADRAGAAIEAVWDQVRRVRDEGVRGDEMDRARSITESRWLRRLEDMEGQANHLAEWESLGRWEMGDEFLARMLAVTSNEVAAAARMYLDDGRASLMVYRPSTAPVFAADAAAARSRLAQCKAEPLVPALSPVPPKARPAVTPRLEREEAGVRVYRLKSGVPILVKQRADAPITYFGAFAVGGACEETAATGGRTLLMARTAVKGTATRDAVQIAEAAERMGGSVSPSVGAETLGWSISVPAKHSEAAVDLLADVSQHPSYAAQALETERAVALADVAALRDDMYRFPARLALQAAFPSHSYGVPTMGSEASLKALTREDLVAWHRAAFLNAPTVLTVVGGDDPDHMAALMASHFDQLAYRAPTPLARPEWPARLVQSVEHREKAQSALVLTWPSPDRADAARFDVAMLSSIASGLGGRFFEELRDKQSLCYTVQAFGSERRAAGTFSAYIATSPEKEDVARDGLLKEMAKLRDSLVTDEELRRAQAYAIGAHAIRLQSSSAVLAEVVDAWIFGDLGELLTFEASVRAVTAEGIRAVARKWFDPDRRVEGVVRGTGKTS